MSPLVSLPNDFEDGVDTAFGSEVRANDDSIVAVLHALDYQNLGLTPDFPGSCISSTSGRRLTQAQMEDDAVDSRVLKDDATVGSPLAAVNNANHIKDGIIPKGKLVSNTLTYGQMDILAQTTAFSFTLGGVGSNILACVSVERVTTGANYTFNLGGITQYVYAGSLSGRASRTTGISPATPIPTANYFLVAAYVADVTYVAATGALSGNLITVALKIA